MTEDEWLKSLGPFPPAPTHERRLIGPTSIQTTWEVTAPMVATLPGGSAVALPVGTTIQEGMTWNGPPADPLRDLLVALKTNPDPALAMMIGKLATQIENGSIPLLSQARTLLQRARPIVKRARDQHPGDYRDARGDEIAAFAGVDELNDEIDAFLAGLPSATDPTTAAPWQIRDPAGESASIPSSSADAGET